MKVYVHFGEKAYPIILDEQQNIKYLNTLAAVLTGYQDVGLSKFPGQILCRGKEISAELTVGNYLEHLDDVYVVRAEEAKQAVEVSTKVEPEKSLKFTSLSQYSFYESGKLWVK